MLMKRIKKLVLLFVLLSFGVIIASCGDPDGGGYKEDIDNHGRYKGELSYNDLLMHYKKFYYKDRVKSAKRWKNTMLAIALSKYYHLNNNFINSKYDSIYSIERDLFNMCSLEEIGTYLHIQDDRLKDLRYKFYHYYSPDNCDLFSVLKFYSGGQQLAVYYFSNDVHEDFNGYNLFNKDLYKKVFSDGDLIIDGTDFGLHLNSKVVPKYIELLSGRFYPYLYVYDFLYDLRYYDISELSFVEKTAKIENTNYLKYYASTRRHFNQIYFNMDDLLNFRKEIHGIIAIVHRSASDFSDEYLSNNNLDDVFSFTLDASNGVKNCKLKQLSLYD